MLARTSTDPIRTWIKSGSGCGAMDLRNGGDVCGCACSGTITGAGRTGSGEATTGAGSGRTSVGEAGSPGGVELDGLTGSAPSRLDPFRMVSAASGLGLFSVRRAVLA